MLKPGNSAVVAPISSFTGSGFADGALLLGMMAWRAAQAFQCRVVGRVVAERQPPPVTVELSVW